MAPNLEEVVLMSIEERLVKFLIPAFAVFMTSIALLIGFEAYKNLTCGCETYTTVGYQQTRGSDE
jgi:hypothetical protein